MSKKEIISVSVFFILIVLIFFHQIFKGLIPGPFDALVGGYYPWHDYNWEYPTGVPIKNPMLSDVFSLAYPSRITVSDFLKKGFLPLWNPYIFSGTPLLATWQSGALYPPTLLMLILGDLPGWTVNIILQPLLTLFFMYLFLREINLSLKSSIFGAIVFSFSGFMMIFLENNSSAQTGIWLPLLLFFAEKYLKKEKIIWLIGLSFGVFLLVTAGMFQVIFYSLAVLFLYSLVRANNFKKRLIIILFIFLGIGLSSIQIIPTLELFNNSIRNYDENIKQYNYGLIPLKNLLTFLAPDFFGNPATYNQWSGLYHEQSGYFGIISWPFVIAALLKKRNFFVSFFGIIFILSLIIVFDTFLGRMIYNLKIPLFSTSYASRALYVLNFSAAVLSAYGLDYLKSSKKIVFKTATALFIILAGLVILNIFLIKFLNDANFKVSLRNTILPFSLISIFLFLLKLLKDIKYLTFALIFLTIFDLFRFGLKFNVFSPPSLAYPKTPVLEFLKKNAGFYRIEREQPEVFPPNTWQAYQLMSPSGYEPLYSLNYANFYNVLNGNLANDKATRYAETRNFKSPLLDLAGVKYFLVAKRNKDNKIDAEKGEVSEKFTDRKFKKVFEDKSIIVLENIDVFPKVSLFEGYFKERDYRKALNSLKGFDFKKTIIINKDPLLSNFKKDENDAIKITEYLPNKVKIESQTKNNTLLMLTDAYYPGWEVYVDGKLSDILIADGIFRAVALPGGHHEIYFIYNPKSFKIGLYLSLASLISIFAAAILLRKNEDIFNYSKL